MPKEIYGVEMLKGVEANIVDRDGNLDIPEEILKNWMWLSLAFMMYVFLIAM